MNIDLNSMSRKELEELKANVEKALANVALREKAAALEAAKKAAEEFGFSLDELTGGKPGGKVRKARAKADAKYRNPSDPEQTWSGMGRRPRWLVDAVENGIPLESMEI